LGLHLPPIDKGSAATANRNMKIRGSMLSSMTVTEAEDKRGPLSAVTSCSKSRELRLFDLLRLDDNITTENQVLFKIGRRQYGSIIVA